MTSPPNPNPLKQKSALPPTPLPRRTEKRCNDWPITKANRQEKTNPNPYNLIPAILPQPQNATKTKNPPLPGEG